MTSSSPPPPPPRRRRSDAYLALLVLGWLLLVVWTIWWAENFSAGMLLPGLWTWVPNRAELGSDLLHNYLGVRDWLAGNNPYTHLFGDPTGIPYNYAPDRSRPFPLVRLDPFRPQPPSSGRASSH